MHWGFDPDPARFADRVATFLEADADRNLPATILRTIRDGGYAAAVLAAGTDAAGDIAAVAMRTPPHPLIVTALAEDGAASFVDAWLAHDPNLPGVNAAAGTAQAVAAAWARRTGGTTRRVMATEYHALSSAVDPPRPAPGSLVVAGAEHRELAVRWWGAFHAEASVVSRDPRDAVDLRLAHRALWLWVDDGEPVSMVAASPRVAGVVRVGPVYTPAERRSRGYASSAVAAASRALLAAGAHTCTLFADLANPTSNRIYRDIGYRRIGTWEEIGFVPRLS